jgi:hypothetical protein
MITNSLKDLLEESVSHNPEIKKKVMLRFGDLPHLTHFSPLPYKEMEVSSFVGCVILIESPSPSEIFGVLGKSFDIICHEKYDIST